AVFELAQQEGNLEKWSGRLSKIRELFDNPRVAAVLSNPTITAERRESLISAAPHLLDGEATNLARLLVEPRRVDEAGAIEDEVARLADVAVTHDPPPRDSRHEIVAGGS